MTHRKYQNLFYNETSKTDKFQILRFGKIVTQSHLWRLCLWSGSFSGGLRVLFNPIQYRKSSFAGHRQTLCRGLLMSFESDI